MIRRSPVCPEDADAEEKIAEPAPLTEKERHYRSLFNQAESRGLSLAQLSVEEDVSAGTLSWWKSEIRRREAARRGKEVTRRNSRCEERVEFVPVGVSVAEDEEAPSPSPAPPVWSFEVALPGGATVRVPGDFEEATLTRVVRAVRNAC